MLGIESLRSQSVFGIESLRSRFLLGLSRFAPDPSPPAAGRWGNPKTIKSVVRLASDCCKRHVTGLMKINFQRSVTCRLQQNPAGAGFTDLIVFGLRKERDSNPRYLAVRRFSRPVQSITLPSFQYFLYCLSL